MSIVKIKRKKELPYPGVCRRFTNKLLFLLFALLSRKLSRWMCPRRYYLEEEHQSLISFLLAERDRVRPAVIFLSTFQSTQFFRFLCFRAFSGKLFVSIRHFLFYLEEPQPEMKHTEMDGEVYRDLDLDMSEEDIYSKR